MGAKKPNTKKTLKGWPLDISLEEIENNIRDFKNKVTAQAARPGPTQVEKDMDTLINNKQGYISTSYVVVSGMNGPFVPQALSTEPIQRVVNQTIRIEIGATREDGIIGLLDFWFGASAYLDNTGSADCRVAVKYNSQANDPTAINLRPDMPSGLPIIFPVNVQVLGAAWGNCSGISPNIPDYLMDSGAFLPQHPDKQMILWEMQKKNGGIPKTMVEDIDENIHKNGFLSSNPNHRLLFWMFLLGYLQEKSTKLNIAAFQQETATIATDAAGIVMRMIDYKLVTLADMGAVVLPNINPKNAQQWHDLYNQQAGLFREKAAILDTFAQVAQMQIPEDSTKK